LLEVTARVANRMASSRTIDYYADDMLGSARTIVQAGLTSVCYDADFLPFGGERVITSTCSQNYKFEGKKRDTETGNDDFGARYYRSNLGRWMSADWSAVPAPVPYANLTNPQTLNLYAMVSDNPETFADLDGHACGNVDGSETTGCTTGGSFALQGEGFAEQPQKTGDNQPPSDSQVQANETSDQQNQAQQPSTSGINPNFKLPSFSLANVCNSSVCAKTLATVSNFAAGAGDCLTGRCIPFVHTSLTEWARGSAADSVVNKNSGAYLGGRISGGVVGSALVSAVGATAAAVADGKNGALFGRGLNTAFNSSDKVRFGWGWKGPAKGGVNIIRLGIGPARGTSWWNHIIFWVVGPKP